MFLWLKANQAFNRTTAHPLDARVRIAHSKGDLIAIHSERAKAVIVTSSLSDEIHAELRFVRQTVRKGRHLEKGPVVSSYNKGMIWTTKFIPEGNSLKYCPHILAHMAGLLGEFRKATGQLEVRTAGNGLPFETINTDASTEAEFRDQVDRKKPRAYSASHEHGCFQFELHLFGR